MALPWRRVVRTDQYRQCVPIGRRDADSWVCPISRRAVSRVSRVYRACSPSRTGSPSGGRSSDYGRLLRRDIEPRGSLNPDAKLLVGEASFHPLVKSLSRGCQLMQQRTLRVLYGREKPSRRFRFARRERIILDLEMKCDISLVYLQRIKVERQILQVCLYR